MIKIITDNPIAIDSIDHLEPLGTKNDNFFNQAFNKKLYLLFRRPIKVIDLGCAGGAFVKSVLDDGYFSIGLEGSDYNFKNKLHEWVTIPNNLHTCDCSKPFLVTDQSRLLKFDVVTSFDFMEHIEEKDLGTLFENMYNLIQADSLLVHSIATFESGEYHKTVQDKDWWVKMFQKYGFYVYDELCDFNYWNTKEWLRPTEPNQRINIIAGLYDKTR